MLKSNSYARPARARTMFRGAPVFVAVTFVLLVVYLSSIPRFRTPVLDNLLHLNLAPSQGHSVEDNIAAPTVINDDFNRYARELLSAWKFKGGVAVALVRAHGAPRVEFGVFGNKTEDGDPVTVDTLFGLASCSKAFTTAALGILMEQYAHGRNTTPLPSGVSELSWSSKMKDLLPQWELTDKWTTERATLQDAVTHMTGMARHDYAYSPTDTANEVIGRMRYLRPHTDLREQWSYNSQMYMAAAQVIPNVAGTSYSAFAKKHVFGPAGMKSTGFSRDTAAQSGHLTHTWNGDGRRIPFWFVDGSEDIVAGPGGAISSAVDLSKWVGTLLNGGVNPCSGKSVMSKHTLDALTTSTAVMEGKAVSGDGSVKGYAKGWWRYSYRGHEILAHSGSAPGMSAHIRILPHDGLGIVALGNSGPANPVTNALARRLMEGALGMENVPWPESPEDHRMTALIPAAGSKLLLPLSAYAGTYSHRAYGNFTLCAPDSTSKYCREVVQTFNAVECAKVIPGHERAHVDQLYGAWARVWSDHIRLTHNRDHLFFNDFPTLFPKGFGKDGTPFLQSSGRDGRGVWMQFGVEDNRVTGVALVEDYSPSVGATRPVDAWFKRL